MTREEIDTIKYKVCCPICDNEKCVKGTDSCEAEQWAKSKAESENKKMETRDVTFKNLTEEQINAIKVLLGDDCDTEQQEEEVEKEEKASFPKHGNIYCFIDNNSKVYQSRWADDEVDRGRLSIENCFKTEKDAKFEAERLRVLHEMKQFAEPEDYKWNDCNNHYYIYYSFLDNTIRTGNCSCSKSNHIYFKSVEDVKICIEAVGEDRIKKYYLEVE